MDNDMTREALARLARQRPHPSIPRQIATEKQIKFVRALIKSRQVGEQQADEIESEILEGLSQSKASYWIRSLKKLPHRRVDRGSGLA